MKTDANTKLLNKLAKASEENAEVLQYLVKNIVTKSEFDKKTDEIDKKIDTIDTRVMLNEQNIQNLRTDIHTMRGTVDNIYNLLDGFVKKIEDEKMERTALHHKVDRHDIWIHDIAKDTNTTLV